MPGHIRHFLKKITPSFPVPTKRLFKDLQTSAELTFVVLLIG